MSILASDFEESFGSNEMGSKCPYAFIGWISYVIDRCPNHIRETMSDEILNAFFHADPIVFGEMFGTAVASIIYRLGHMLDFSSKKCFIERPEIRFRKHPTLFGHDQKYKYELHIYIESEEIIGMKLPIDPQPDWTDGEWYAINNPYYQE